MSITCPSDIIAGCDICKETRHQLHGQVAGGAGSRKPEEWQRAKIAEGTGKECKKTDMRINKRTLELRENKQPMKEDDGFDWTENFDGYQRLNGKKFYYNLKCVVGTGGSQTRTLRDECYPFVEAQLNYLLANPEDEKTHFTNIFDGDECHKRMSKFAYLLGLDEYAHVHHRVYVGDLKSVFEWLESTTN